MWSIWKLGMRRSNAIRRGGLALLAVSALALAGATCAQSVDPEPVGFRLFTSPQSNPIALSPDGAHLYVANTTSNNVQVIDTLARKVIATIPVGVDPVSVAVRPPLGHEVWVSNHVSDSISVISTLPGPHQYTVVHTIDAILGDGVPLIDIHTGLPRAPVGPQALADAKVTDFDEPVGIAFTEDGAKAYVAISSRNRVGVIDADGRVVTKLLQLNAQDPRALAVRGDLLYVPVFESSNQTELSACPFDTDQGQPNTAVPQCSLDEYDIGEFVPRPNLPDDIKHIPTDPDVPDRDLFVFDVREDADPDNLVAVVNGVGTLLYGVAVGADGRAFITNTDARNGVNGRHDDSLLDLDNRMFDNMITDVTCTLVGCSAPHDRNLDNPVPSRAEALATPYGIAISGNDAVIVATAAATSRVFTMRTSDGVVLDRFDLATGSDFADQIPRGVALHSSPSGEAHTAYVLNTLENTVSVLDVSDPTEIRQIGKRIGVGDDPTPEPVRRGRIAFNNALGSDSGNFACASCHPDGNTDQLIWRIGGACTFAENCSGDEPRTTMPIRGLRYTLPLHWDGSLGDATAGPNGAVGPGGFEPAQCSDEHSCFRHLVDASLSGVMCDQSGGCQLSDHPTLAGRLTEPEREDMAFFLGEVSYPPARMRQLDDGTTQGFDGGPDPEDFTDDIPGARAGFDDFFTDQGGLGSLLTSLGQTGVNTCGDSDAGCHALPMLAGTDSETLMAFDIPTMRGLNDRYLQFSNGISSAEENLVTAVCPDPSRADCIAPLPIPGFPVLLDTPPSPLPWSPEIGFDEEVIFATSFAAFTPIYGVGPFHIFQMIEEMSTGYSGAFARQVTLNEQTAGQARTSDLMSALQDADLKGLVNLRGNGVRNGGVFEASFLDDGTYYGTGGVVLTPTDVLNEAQTGDLTLTLTAHLRYAVGDPALHQPVISPLNTGAPRPAIPLLPTENPMTLAGQAVTADAQILIDGQVVGGSIACVGGSFTPTCDSSVVEITLASPPLAVGLYLMQVQTQAGLLSNELPLCVPAAGPGPARNRCGVPGR